MAICHTLKTKYKIVANYTTYFVLTFVTIEKEPFRITSISILFHCVNFASKKQNPNQIESKRAVVDGSQSRLGSRDWGASKQSEQKAKGRLFPLQRLQPGIYSCCCCPHTRPSVPSLALLSQPHT
jgi:hypothetical protein